MKRILGAPGTIYVVLILFGLTVLAAAQPTAPDSFLSPLKKGTEITLKETPSGYRITLQSPGTHKVIASDPEFVTITDATGVTTTRINKTAILAISEIKLPK